MKGISSYWNNSSRLCKFARDTIVIRTREVGLKGRQILLYIANLIISVRALLLLY